MQTSQVRKKFVAGINDLINNLLVCFRLNVLCLFIRLFGHQLLREGRSLHSLLRRLQYSPHHLCGRAGLPARYSLNISRRLLLKM